MHSRLPILQRYSEGLAKTTVCGSGFPLSPYSRECGWRKSASFMQMISMNNLSSALSKWFGRFKTAVGIVSRKRTFHSFRHTFLNALKQLGVEEAIIKELAGHANGSITSGRYGKRYGVQVGLEAIERIKFESP